MKNSILIIFIALLAFSCGTDEPKVQSDENYILDFSFTEQTSASIIDLVNKVVTVEVESNTDLSALVPSIDISEKATISLAPTSTDNFYKDVVYTVTAENGLESEWKVVASIAPDYQMLDIGTHSLEVTTTGTGEFTLLLDLGLSGLMDQWMTTNLYTRLSEHGQVIAYHRSAYGNSERGPQPRTINQMTDEMKALVDALSDNDKVIILGNSWGGALARAFAIRFPDKVAGILFGDTAHEENPASINQDQVDFFITQTDVEGAKDELANLIETRSFLGNIGNLPDIPMTMMTARNPDFDYAYRFSLQASLGTGVSPSNFRHITVQTDHQIHMEDPDIVLTEMSALLARVQ